MELKSGMQLRPPMMAQVKLSSGACKLLLLLLSPVSWRVSLDEEARGQV